MNLERVVEILRAPDENERFDRLVGGALNEMAMRSARATVSRPVLLRRGTTVAAGTTKPVLVQEMRSGILARHSLTTTTDRMRPGGQLLGRGYDHRRYVLPGPSRAHPRTSGLQG